MNQTRRIAARHISPCNAFTSLMSGTAAATNRANVLQYSGMRGIVVCLDGRLRAGVGVTARHRAAMACLPPVDMCLPIWPAGCDVPARLSWRCNGFMGCSLIFARVWASRDSVG